MATVGETANPTSPEMKATGSVTPPSMPTAGASIPAEPATPEPATKADIADIVDKVIAMGFKMEKDLKENEADEKSPGELGRLAERRGPRLRRKSRDLAEEFQKLMGPKLEAVFKEMDEDGSGNLDASELEKAFAAAGRPSDPETIANAIKTLDTDGDGLISLEEFKAIAWKCALG